MSSRSSRTLTESSAAVDRRYTSSLSRTLSGESAAKCSSAPEKLCPNVRHSQRGTMVTRSRSSLFRLSPAEESLSRFRRPDDNERESDTHEPPSEAQVLGVEEPLEQAELGRQHDRSHGEPAHHQEPAVVEDVQAEDRAPLVPAFEGEEEVCDRKGRQRHGPGEDLPVVVVHHPGQAHRDPSHRQAVDGEPNQKSAWQQLLVRRAWLARHQTLARLSVAEPDR